MKNKPNLDRFKQHSNDIKIIPIKWVKGKRLDPLTKVTLPCLECGQEYEFDEDSNQANLVLNVFCPNGECEDKYAFKQ